MTRLLRALSGETYVLSLDTLCSTIRGLLQSTFSWAPLGGLMVPYFGQAVFGAASGVSGPLWCAVAVWALLCATSAGTRPRGPSSAFGGEDFSQWRADIVSDDLVVGEDRLVEPAAGGFTGVENTARTGSQTAPGAR